MSAQKTEWEWDDAFSHLQWQAQAGINLRITFSHSQRPTYFPMAQREQGLAYWKAYRTQFNRFIEQATLFYPL